MQTGRFCDSFHSFTIIRMRVFLGRTGQMYHFILVHYLTGGKKRDHPPPYAFSLPLIFILEFNQIMNGGD